jgi:1-acyl-sn-glycerol-3-phosphate acyltransferase
MPPQPKPVAATIRPEITHLPLLNPWRKIARRAIHGLARFLLWLFARVSLEGMENVPAQGGALIIFNHLGDADFVVGMGKTPRPLELIAKAELRDYPILGWLLEAYGVIWIHRGQPDRRALRSALQGLSEGRLVCISPEARESLTGGLEEATQGAAYLAYKSGALLLPVVFTGTENSKVFSAMKRLKRTPVTMTIGHPFYLAPEADLRQALQSGTEKIMCTLASMLPVEYQGDYRIQQDTISPMKGGSNEDGI